MLNAEAPAGAISRCSIDIKRRLSAPSVSPPILSWRTIDLMLQKLMIHKCLGRQASPVPHAQGGIAQQYDL